MILADAVTSINWTAAGLTMDTVYGVIGNNISGPLGIALAVGALGLVFKLSRKTKGLMR